MVYPYDIGDIPISGRIGITGLADTYATHIDVLGQGGLQSIETVADRDSIPASRRKFGMLVTVYLDGTPANNKTYILANIALGGTNNTITDNANWITFSGGAGGDMLAATYDPNNIGADAFDYTNFINTPTNVSAFINDAGYLTVAGDVSQNPTGTQTANTIAFWNGTAKQLEKTSSLMWEESTKALSIINTNDIVFGSASNIVTNAYFGKGKSHATPANNVFIQATSATNANNNQMGSRLYLRPGAGTGTSIVELVIQTPDPIGTGAVVQSYTDHMTFNPVDKATFPYGRFIFTEGNNITAATNIALGKGNFHTINGNGTISTISASNWSSAGDNPGGAFVVLLLTGTSTIKNLTAGTGTQVRTLSGLDIVSTGNKPVGLVLDSNNGIWIQVF